MLLLFHGHTPPGVGNPHKAGNNSNGSCAAPPTRTRRTHRASLTVSTRSSSIKAAAALEAGDTHSIGQLRAELQALRQQVAELQQAQEIGNQLAALDQKR